MDPIIIVIDWSACCCRCSSSDSSSMDPIIYIIDISARCHSSMDPMDWYVVVVVVVFVV